MIERLKRLPLHAFLLPLFFVLHVVNEYYGLLPFLNVFRYLIYYFLLSVFLLLVGKAISKSWLRAGYWTTLILTVFYFFGAAHDGLKSVFANSFFSTYTFALSLCIMVLIFVSLLLKRNSRPMARLNNFLNLLFAVFALFECAQLADKRLTRKDAANNFQLLHRTDPGELFMDKTKIPDIFFIVFDEYASSASLKKYEGFDNKMLDSIFVTNHFYISTLSKSNYNSTPFSLASTLTMDYFDQPLEFAEATSKLRLQAFHTLKLSNLFSRLHEQGYSLVNLALTDLKDQPVQTFEFSKVDKLKPLYLETLWGRVDRDLGWHVVLLFPALGQQSEANHQRFINRNNFNLQSTLNELKVQDKDHPKFVFTHVMLPHRPFYMDSLGRRRNTDSDSFNNNDDSLYVNQVIYTNKWIAKLVSATNRSFERPRVVIIEGDHGFRALNLSESSIREKEFMNLNAYFFSDGDYHLLYDSISPVNSFRVVLNKYFKTQLPLLKDSCVIMK